MCTLIFINPQYSNRIYKGLAEVVVGDNLEVVRVSEVVEGHSSTTRVVEVPASEGEGVVDTSPRVGDMMGLMTVNSTMMATGCWWWRTGGVQSAGQRVS